MGEDVTENGNIRKRMDLGEDRSLVLYMVSLVLDM